MVKAHSGRIHLQKKRNTSPGGRDKSHTMSQSVIRGVAAGARDSGTSDEQMGVPVITESLKRRFPNRSRDVISRDANTS